MKNIILLAFATICWLTTIGQQENDSNYYYYYKGVKKYVTLDKSKINITTKYDINKSSILSSNFKDFELLSDSSNGFPSKFGKIDFMTIPNDSIYNLEKIKLKQNNNIIAVSPYFFISDTISIGTSHLFYVKLKAGSDTSLLKAYADTFNVNIVSQFKFMPLWYKLSLKENTQATSLEIANLFYETGLFEAVDHAFMVDIQLNCTNDPNFSDLWGLNNTQNTDIDINICDAWQISQGEGVKVAVFDNYLDRYHNDLINNIISDESYHYYLGANKALPSENTDMNHATHVAGIIAASKNNNLDVVGVAPESKLMSVNFQRVSTADPDRIYIFAEGMNWASNKGADIINNSWSMPLLNLAITPALEDAITSVLQHGRNDKGSIVVFAAGNEALNVSYPANTNSDIICVGSINRYGEVSLFSNFGDALDVVAPGEEILSTFLDNSVGYMTGTSMAAPYVSGIAALILSKNPDLTQKQVATIIEQTAKKIGNYDYRIDPNHPNGTWCEYAGYGLVDAYAALQKVQCYQNIIPFNGNITENTIWNVDKYIYGNIIIEPGATLTITSTIYCDQSTNILVKPGAKLIIDGGKLTND